MKKIFFALFFVVFTGFSAFTVMPAVAAAVLCEDISPYVTGFCLGDKKVPESDKPKECKTDCNFCWCHVDNASPAATYDYWFGFADDLKNCSKECQEWCDEQINNQTSIYNNWLLSTGCSIKVNLYKNGGSGKINNDSSSNPVAITCVPGSITTLPAYGSGTDLSKSGKIFMGWSTSNNATTGVTSITCPNSDTDYYAAWATPTCTAGTGVGSTSLNTVTGNAPVCNRSSIDGYYCPATQTGNAGVPSLTVQCTAASNGYYATAGSTSQTKCAIGSYSSSASMSSSCTACPGGRTTSTTGTNYNGTPNTACSVACSGTNVVSWATTTWSNSPTANTVSNLCVPETCTACSTGTGATSCSYSVSNGVCTYTGVCSDGYNTPTASGTVVTCSPNQVVLDYDENGGGAVSNGSCTYGGNLTLPSAPTRTGYTFAGWKLNDNQIKAAGASVTNGCTYTYTGTYDGTNGDTTTIQAQWTPITYNVNWSLDGGNWVYGFVVSNPLVKSYDEVWSFNDRPGKSGYTFAGWNITNYNGTPQSGSSSDLLSNIVSFSNVGDTYFKNMRSTSGTVNFTASWVLNSNTPHNLSYSCGTGTGTAPSTASYTEGTVVTLASNTCSQTNATFAGWECVTDITNNQITMPGFDVVCTATWSCDTGYSVDASPLDNVNTSLNGTETTNGASFSYGLVEIQGKCSTTSGTFGVAGNPSDTAGNHCWCQVQAFTPSGGTRQTISILPWVYDSNRSSISSCQSGCLFECSKDIAYVSEMRQASYIAYVCNPNTYNITYVLNGGTSGANAPTSATYGTSFTVDNPTRYGYAFTGWNITGMDNVTHTYGSSTSNNTSLNGVTATNFMNLRSTSGTVTFTATWAVKPSYTITLNKGNGSGGANSVYTVHNTNVFRNSSHTEAMTENSNSITVPSYDFYGFVGYYETQMSLSDVTPASTNRLIDENGYITSYGLSTLKGYNSTTTIYARYSDVCNLVDFDTNTYCGVSNSAKLFYRASTTNCPNSGSAYYRYYTNVTDCLDNSCTTDISSFPGAIVSTPKPHSTYVGHYAQFNLNAYTHVISTNGSLDDLYVHTAGNNGVYNRTWFALCTCDNGWQGSGCDNTSGQCVFDGACTEGVSIDLVINPTGSAITGASGGDSELYTSKTGNSNAGVYTDFQRTFILTTSDGYAVNIPNAPAHATFLGYYSAVSGGTQYIDSYGQITVDGITTGTGYGASDIGANKPKWYAQYQCDDGYHASNGSCVANTCTIKLKSGNTTLATQNITYGTTTALTTSYTAPVASNKGWSIHGWATDYNTTTSTYSNGQSNIGNICTTNNSTITLYGIWKRDVKFEYYSTSGATATTQTTKTQYYYNTNASTAGVNGIQTESLYTSTAGGSWAPKGWLMGSTSNNGTVTVAQTNATAVTVTPSATDGTSTGVIYYAVYKRTPQVAYNGGSGSGTMPNSDCNEQYYNAGGVSGSSVQCALSSSSFTPPTSYSFGAWAAGSVSGSQYSAGANYTFSNASWTGGKTAVTMYAVYSLDEYVITLDKVDGEGGSDEIYTIYGQGVYLGAGGSDQMTATSNPIEMPIQQNYVFTGYYENPEGDGDQFISSNGYITQEGIDRAIYSTDDTWFALYEECSCFSGAHVSDCNVIETNKYNQCIYSYSCDTGYTGGGTFVGYVGKSLNTSPDCNVNSYTITVVKGYGVSSVAPASGQTGWTNVTNGISKTYNYGDTITLANVITPTFKSGYSGSNFVKDQNSPGTMSNNVFTVGTGNTTITLNATTLAAPDDVTISKTQTNTIYNGPTSAATVTATATVNTPYDNSVTLYYSFGLRDFQPVDSGSVYNYGNYGTSNTISFTSNQFRGLKYYRVKVKAVGEGGIESSELASYRTGHGEEGVGYVAVTLRNIAFTFDAETNGGTLSGTSPLYIAYDDANLYTGAYVTTTASVPTATKTDNVFTGWWSASSGGAQIYNANLELQGNVSGVTSNTNPPKFIYIWNKTLYAQFAGPCTCTKGANVDTCTSTGVSNNKCQYSYTCNTGYHVGSGSSTSGTFEGSVGVTSNTSPSCNANNINLSWYKENGTTAASGVPSNGNTCTYDTQINLPTNPTKPGYTFMGWEVF